MDANPHKENKFLALEYTEVINLEKKIYRENSLKTYFFFEQH